MSTQYNIVTSQESLAPKYGNDKLEELESAGLITNPDEIAAEAFDWPDDTIEAIAGVVLHDADFVRAHRNVIKPEYWREKSQQDVVRAILKLSEDGQHPDKTTVRLYLHNTLPEHRRELTLGTLEAINDNHDGHAYRKEQLLDFLRVQTARQMYANSLKFFAKRPPNWFSNFRKHINTCLDAVDAQASNVNPFWSIGYILSDEIPKPMPLIKDHLVQGETAWLNAEPAVGKTYVALSMALCVATGHKWLDLYDVHRAPVLYFGEEGKLGNPERVKAWCLANGVVPKPDMFTMLPLNFDLRSEGNQIIALIERWLPLKPQMIVIDTQANMLGGGNDNEGETMLPYLAEVAKIRQHFGAAMLICSHPGHENKRRPRGHSSQVPVAETVMLLEGKLGSAEGATLEIVKQKSSEPIPTYQLQTVRVGSNMAIVGSENYKPAPSKQKQHKSELRDKMTERWRKMENRNFTFTDAVNACKGLCSETTVRTALREMTDSEELSYDNSSRLYTLAI